MKSDNYDTLWWIGSNNQLNKKPIAILCLSLKIKYRHYTDAARESKSFLGFMQLILLGLEPSINHVDRFLCTFGPAPPSLTLY